MKICNKSKRYKLATEICQHHENGKCPHWNWHSDMHPECNLEVREAAGLQPNCMHYRDQRCIEIILTFKEVKE